MRPEPPTPAIATRALAYAATVPGGSAPLRGVTLRVELGEVVALAGPVDAGASTLLRVIAGDLRPSAGSVRVLGRDPRAGLGRRPHAGLGRGSRIVPEGRPVFLCEPPQHVDDAGVLPWLRGHAADGRAVIVSTTDLRLAATCDRAVVLWGGRVVGTVPGGSTTAIERVLADAALVRTAESPVLLTADG